MIALEKDWPAERLYRVTAIPTEVITCLNIVMPFALRVFGITVHREVYENDTELKGAEIFVGYGND